MHVLFGEALDETRRISGAVSMILLVVLLVQRPDHGVICLLVLLSSLVASFNLGNHPGDPKPFTETLAEAHSRTFLIHV